MRIRFHGGEIRHDLCVVPFAPKHTAVIQSSGTITPSGVPAAICFRAQMTVVTVCRYTDGLPISGPGLCGQRLDPSGVDLFLP